MSVNFVSGLSGGAAMAVDPGEKYQYNAGALEIDQTAAENGVQTSVKHDVVDDKKQENKQDDKDLEKRMEDAITNANEKVRHIGQRQCEFAYDKKARRISIKVYDAYTKEVIREIPPEKTLELIERLYDLEGIMVDEKR